MSHEAPAKSERKSETTRFGVCFTNSHGRACRSCCYHIRTLATDRGFKERVREDMLVRLLDAFVWKNHGQNGHHPLALCAANFLNR